MNGKRFDFCDYVTEEEGAFFNRTLAAVAARSFEPWPAAKSNRRP